jgi:hypothetical protein
MTYNAERYQMFFWWSLRQRRSLGAELVKRRRLDNNPATVEGAVIDHQ